MAAVAEVTVVGTTAEAGEEVDIARSGIEAVVEDMEGA
jgi:hypothetical protein